MIINALTVINGKIEVNQVDFAELISAIEPGNPESYNSAIEKLKDRK